MSRQRYLGISDPAGFVAALAPMRQTLADARLKCSPFGAQYLAIDKMIEGIDAGARDLLGEDTPFKPAGAPLNYGRKG